MSFATSPYRDVQPLFRGPKVAWFELISAECAALAAFELENMAIFQEFSRVKDIKLPPRRHFDSGAYAVNGEFMGVDEADCLAFLEKLRVCGIPSVAARECGRTEIVYQVERAKNEDFAAAWDWAEREAADLLHKEARRRAVDGVEKSVFYKGEEIDVVREYSDTLLALLLKSTHPDFKQVEEESDRRDAPVRAITLAAIPAGHFVCKIDPESDEDERETPPEDE